MRWIGSLFVLVLLAFTGFATGHTNSRVALVIGNGNYRHVTPLPNPPNDVDAISTKLASLGFTVRKLVDSDLESTRAALDEFEYLSARAEIGLIFYAGHGLQIAGENYLLPVDAQIARADDLGDAALPASELHAALAAAQPNLAVLILDACRDNPFVKVVSGTQGLASGSTFGGEGEERRASNVLIAFAAAPGAVAADGSDGNSPFTTALLRWIDRPGLEIGTMFRRVRQTVVELTGGAQVPWVEESLLQDVYLNPAAPPSAWEAPPPLDVALLSTIQNMEDPAEQGAAFAYYDRLVSGAKLEEGEIQAIRASLDRSGSSSFLQESMIWLSIRESKDPNMFKTFLDHFPDSAFAELAGTHLAALASPAPVTTPTAALRPADAPAVSTPNSPFQAEAPEKGELALSAAEHGLEEVKAAPALTQTHRIAAQRLLAELGFYRGRLDGAIGPSSRSAIRTFQAAEGLEPHGALDRLTLLRLVERAARAVLAVETGRDQRLGLHALAAVARGEAGAEPVTLRVASIARHGDVHDYWRRLADTFEAEHPGTIIEFSLQAGTDYKRNLLVMLGSDTPPDIFFSWGGGHLRSIGEAGFVRDLTAEMAEGWALQFKPAALKNLTVDGRVHGVPMQMTLVSLWANRTLLEQAGVQPDPLRTWGGFVEVVAQLKANGITPLAVGAAERWPIQFYWGSLAEARGGPQAVTRALSGEALGFSAPAFVDAGALTQDLAMLEPFQPNYIDAWERDAVTAFAKGETAMMLAGNWTLWSVMNQWPGGPQQAAQELVRLDFPPADLGADGPVTYGGTDAWVIRREAPEPALDFLRLLAGLDSQRAVAELGHGVPAIAGADTALRNPLLQEIAKTLAASRHHQLFIDQELGPEAGEVVNNVALALIEGDLTPERAAAEVEAAWERVRGGRHEAAPVVPAETEAVE